MSRWTPCKRGEGSPPFLGSLRSPGANAEILQIRNRSPRRHAGKACKQPLPASRHPDHQERTRRWDRASENVIDG